ncbi:golgin candidate 2-like isoform X2 [Strongylocentrotus purpuratus]|uniref:RING-type domain-containing protein n=1 Tax=Strongylocentrotus purpuratus TaxID=7668 RepID=A0A7M7T169_STRPU|nr:golgin candidate 2-like isoform X2 [Strongylocentrotus purpuratus]
MAERLKGSLTEKVGEIKRMQSNWMRERSQNIDGRESMGETREGGGERKGRDKSARKSAQTNDKSGSETMSWSMGNSKKKPLSTQNSTKPSTKQQTLRTRSASPARSATNSAKKSPSASSSSAASKRNGSSSRPSSARSTASEGSRPPSGRNYPSSSQPDKSARTDHKRRIPPDHSATLLVPCGHTLCEACAEDRIKCPTCRTRVTSTSLNSTLQEIISSSRPNSGACPLASHSQPLTNHRTPSDVNQNHVSTHSTNHYPDSHRTQQYTPSRYADEGQVHSRPEGGTEHLTRGFNNNDNNARTRESKDAGSEKVDVARSRRKMSPEEEARKLEDEYQSLGIRCEALESEEADVVERVEKQNQEIAKHKQQMGNISQKQQHLRDEIKSLEKRLAGLEGHRQEYKRQVEDAEDRKREELDQLAMVRTMLRDKQRDRERVKMSARKLNVSLD